MKSRYFRDFQDPSDSFLDSAGAEVYGHFSLPAGRGNGNPRGPGQAEISFTPALISDAVQSSSANAQSGSGGPGSVVAVASGSGITINLLFDAAAMAAPASFRAGIQQAASILSATISDKITVNIKIDYSGTGGGAAAGPDAGYYESYSSVRANLINNATPGDTIFNALPGGTSIQGQTNVAVWSAQLKLWGILGANDTTTDDGSATFATDINSNLLVGVALHELTHAMGRVPYGTAPDIFDLFRFTSPGTRLFVGGNTAPASYFSADGGITKLADFGQTSDPSDFLNSGVQGPNDPFNEFYGGSTVQSLSAIDREQLDALGFHLGSRGIVVAATASQALQGGAAVALLSGPPTITDTTSTTLSSATIKIANAGGSTVSGDLLYVNGTQNGSVGNGVTASWNASTGTMTLTGSATLAVYDTLLSEVSYQDTGIDLSSGSHPQRTVTWTVNDGAASFNTTSQIAIDRAPATTVANVALNSDYTPVAASSLFTASDPDGDVLATYAFKDTGNGHFYLNGVAQANNQEIDVTAAQLSLLTYQSTGGVDSLQVRANDGTLWSAWNAFTVTGPTPTVIEAFGSTSPVQAGSYYFLDPVAGGIGPELKSSGVPVVAGQTGGWTPIGAEQTASGYEVAWKLTGTNQYSVWSTDSSGNYTSNLIGIALGTDPALQSIETSFHQDLNGDGTIGLVATVIESLGSTSLVQSGSNYFLDPVAGGIGPELKSFGVPVVAGQSGGWAPIGAEQTASGYEVAWKLTSTNQYSVWSTDSSGNYTSNLIGIALGTDPALQSIETSFHQDLNGDGTIGLVATVIESLGSTSLVQSGGNYFLDPAAGGTGPELKSSGVPVVAGQSGGWTPIGAEQTASGYEVAWKLAGTNQYSVWSTDSSGNYTSNLIGIALGTDPALQSIETSFHQDLNGDGTIGLVATVIESLGSTSLVQSGGNYFLDSVAGGTGPELKSSGVGIVAGQSGGWTPIGAEQTASGYEVAWKLTGTNQYSVWSTDSSGNYTSNLIGIALGTDPALQSIETSFHQDLNGDGTIGIVATVIESLGSTSLVQSGSNYFLNPVAGSTGPELKSSGVPVVAGQSGGWAPIGAEQTASGYEVAWKLTGTNQYSVWSTDSSGNYTSNLIGIALGTDPALQSIETSFHQDLNGDGVIGVPAAAVPAATAASALNLFVTVGHDSFVFAPNFGQVTIADFNPTTDTIQFSKAVFANLEAVLAATHDDGNGSAVIADAAHDTITIQHVTVAQMLAHQGDFHFL